MIRITLVFLLMLAGMISPLAQTNQETEKESRFYMEGSLRLAFGDKTRLGISPAINYRLAPSLSVGAGLIAESFQNKTADQSSYHTGIFGSNIIINYKVDRFTRLLNSRTSIYLHFEQEFLNLEDQYFSDSGNSGRSWYNASFLGLKVKRKIGNKNRFAISLIAAWNLNNNGATDIIYNNPVIKLGFQF